MTRAAIVTGVILLALPLAAAGQTPPPPRPPWPVVVPELDAGMWAAPDREWRIAGGEGGQQFVWNASPYAAGLRMLDRRQYEAAIERFAEAIEDGDARADGALYWKAFAEYRLGRIDEARASLERLRREFAGSAYLRDARLLEADLEQLAGQPVDADSVAAIDDDEVRLLAIAGIQRSDPEGVIPLLEGVLGASNSLALKKRALYVLALSSLPRAQTILLDHARGAGNPDLQIEAIRYVAAEADDAKTGLELRRIYTSSDDVAVRRAVIDAFRPVRLSISVLGGGSAWALTTRPLRPSAGGVAPTELFRLYELESDPNLRLQMVLALDGLGAVEQLDRVARTETSPTVRVRAIRSLGNQDARETTNILVGLYRPDQDVAVRRAVIGALGRQRNAQALVDIARRERDRDLRTELIRQLSTLAAESTVAENYLKEIIR